MHNSLSTTHNNNKLIRLSTCIKLTSSLKKSTILRLYKKWKILAMHQFFPKKVLLKYVIYVSIKVCWSEIFSFINLFIISKNFKLFLLLIKYDNDSSKFYLKQIERTYNWIEFKLHLNYTPTLSIFEVPL